VYVHMCILKDLFMKNTKTYNIHTYVIYIYIYRCIDILIYRYIYTYLYILASSNEWMIGRGRVCVHMNISKYIL